MELAGVYEEREPKPCVVLNLASGSEPTAEPAGKAPAPQNVGTVPPELLTQPPARAIAPAGAGGHAG